MGGAAVAVNKLVKKEGGEWCTATTKTTHGFDGWMRNNGEKLQLVHTYSFLCIFLLLFMFFGVIKFYTHKDGKNNRKTFGEKMTDKEEGTSWHGCC